MFLVYIVQPALSVTLPIILGGFWQAGDLQGRSGERASLLPRSWPHGNESYRAIKSKKGRIHLQLRK